MATADVEIFNVIDGDAVAQIQGAKVNARAGAPSAQQLSNPVDVEIAGASVSAESGTSVVPGSGKRWHPGHYQHIQLDHAKASESINDVKALLLSKYPASLDSIDLKGNTTRIGWGDLEPTLGNYAFGPFEDLLNWHSQNNRKMCFQPLWKFFQGAEPNLNSNRYNRICPSDLVTAGGVWATKTGGIAKVWLPSVMDHWLAFWDEIGSRYGNESSLEWVFTTESSPSLDLAGNDPGDYSTGNYGAQLERIITQSVLSFPNSNATLTINSLGGDEAARLLEVQYQAGLSDSTPDARNTTGFKLFRGESGGGSGTGVRDYRSLMGHLTLVSASSMNNHGTAAAQGQFADDNDVSHLCWVKTTSQAGFHWTNDVIPYIEGESFAPGDGKPLFTDCPPNYPACDLS